MCELRRVFQQWGQGCVVVRGLDGACGSATSILKPQLVKQHLLLELWGAKFQRRIQWAWGIRRKKDVVGACEIYSIRPREICVESWSPCN